MSFRWKSGNASYLISTNYCHKHNTKCVTFLRRFNGYWPTFTCLKNEVKSKTNEVKIPNDRLAWIAQTNMIYFYHQSRRCLKIDFRFAKAREKKLRYFRLFLITLKWKHSTTFKITVIAPFFLRMWFIFSRFNRKNGAIKNKSNPQSNFNAYHFVATELIPVYRWHWSLCTQSDNRKNHDQQLHCLNYG